MTSREHSRRLLLILLATDGGADRLGGHTARPARRLERDTDVQPGAGVDEMRRFITPPSIGGADRV